MENCCTYQDLIHKPMKRHSHEHSCNHSHHNHSHNHSHSHSHEHHDHSHNHSYDFTKNKKALLLSFIVTFVVMFAELIYGYLANSLALISDALHMITHAFALIISFIALIFINKQDSKKTYGYYRSEIIAAFINAIMIAIFTIFIIYEAIEKLLNPSKIDIKTMLIVSCFGLVANIISALLLMKADTSNLNIKSSLIHMLSDLLSSVAIIIGGIIVYYTDFYFIDSILALIIALVIAKWSISLFKQSLDILLESSFIEISEVKEFILKQDLNIKDIHDIHIHSISQDYHILTAHIILDDLNEFKSVLQKLNALLKNEFNIHHITIQPETI